MGVYAQQAMDGARVDLPKSMRFLGLVAPALAKIYWLIAHVHDSCGHIQRRKVLAADAELTSLLGFGAAGRNAFYLDTRIVVDLPFVNRKQQEGEFGSLSNEDIASVAILPLRVQSLLRRNEGRASVFDLPVVHEFYEGPSCRDVIFGINKLHRTAG